MGVYAVWALTCDHPGCGTGYPAPYRATASAFTIRNAAARDGWHATKRGKVFCPDHIPARHRRTS